MIELRRPTFLADAEEDASSLREAERKPDLGVASAWVAGELSPGDAALARDRYDEEPTFREMVDSAAVAWRLPGRVIDTPVERDALRDAWEEFRGRAGLVAVAAPGTDRDTLVAELARARRRKFLGAWLTLIFSVAASFWSWRQFAREFLHGDRRNELVAAAADSAQLVVLPNRVSVTLSPGSTLRYEERLDLTGETREAWLRGEGDFVVPSGETSHELRIHTDAALVTANGATFTVHEYAGEPATDVDVASGRVSVHAAARGLTVEVTKGQRARVPRNGVGVRLLRDVVTPK